MKKKILKNIFEYDFVIPVEGSLGLFALGDKGLREWRKVKKIAESNIKNIKIS